MAIHQPGDEDQAELAARGVSIHWVEDAFDPAVAEFRDLKEPGVGLGPHGPHFVVEGPEAIRLLLASDFLTEKVLLKPSLLGSMRDSFRSRDRPVSLLLCAAPLLQSITGISAKHAAAALALARRKVPLSLKEIGAFNEGPFRALALEGLDEEAVGALFRVAAGFGVNVVLLDTSAADPFHRRAVRVSMGHVLRVPCVRGPMPELLQQLQQADVEVIASCDGVSDCCFLDEVDVIHNRWACVLSSGWIPEARHVAIRKGPIPLGAAVTASILLNGCVERAKR